MPCGSHSFSLKHRWHFSVAPSVVKHNRSDAIQYGAKHWIILKCCSELAALSLVKLMTCAVFGPVNIWKYNPCCIVGAASCIGRVGLDEPALD
jgi:hypothetical protein